MKSLEEMMGELPVERQASIKARTAELVSEELTLKGLRQALNLTQDEMAQRLEVGQDNVSRLEKRDDLKLSTLRGYVEALGGELQLKVSLPGKSDVDLKLFG